MPAAPRRRLRLAARLLAARGLLAAPAQAGLIDTAVLLYAFVALAIVCDTYFVTSLQHISKRLRLSDNVAGATFMAAASSAPELFISIADNVLQEPGHSVGIGTIMGSAIFNALVINALVALLAPRALQLDWRPYARDMMWCSLSYLLLTAVVWDAQVELWESILLVLAYGGYLVNMKHNDRFLRWLDRFSPAPAAPRVANNAMISPAPESCIDVGGVDTIDGEPVDETKEPGQVAAPPAAAAGRPRRCRALAAAAWRVLVLPLHQALRLTVPDCRVPRWQGRAGVWGSFTMCVVWIGGLCFLVTDRIDRLADTLAVPTTIMALFVVAIATSIPDALASVYVAREGQGDMAVSNANGSNIFDILLGCGVPFALSNLVYRKPVVVQTEAIMPSMYTLLGIFAAMTLLLRASRWRMHTRTGAALLSLYVCYAVITCAHQV